MARQSSTFQKREKEKSRIQKQKDKEARRLESKERKATTTTDIGDEDPDIAGIRPGPQPLPDQWNYDQNGGAESEREAQSDK